MKADLAEFHDIGKLIDWKALGLQLCDPAGNPIEREPHDFEKCKGAKWGINFSAPVWEACFRKDTTVIADNYKGSMRWALVSLADELAAGVGRLREESVQGSPQYAYHCLWTGQTEPELRIVNAADLENLISYLNTNPSWQEARHKYSTPLRSRAETARPGLNVTTLLSHCALTGKLFRILRLLPQACAGTFESYTQAHETLGQSKLTVLHVKVNFVQRPFRVRDLFVFQQRREVLEQLAAKYSDNVLVAHGETVLALCPSSQQADDFLKAVSAHGYVAFVRRSERTLAEIKSYGIQELLETGRTSEAWIIPALPDSIELPLCENCQMAHADRSWPIDFLRLREDLSLETREIAPGSESPGLRAAAVLDRARITEQLEEEAEEHLCSLCFELRSRSEPLKRLAAWQRGDVAWVRVGLDLGDLVKALRSLHTDHIKASARQIQPNFLTNLPVRFSMLADFCCHYEQFLGRWASRVRATFPDESVELVDRDLLCVKLSEKRSVLGLMGIHSQLMHEYFPKLIGLGVSPIRLAISVSSVKHPFFVHWRFLENPSPGVGIQAIGAGIAEIPLRRLDDVLQAIGKGERRALIRLRQISQTSRKLAELVLASKQDRDREAFAHIAPLGLDFESLTIIANLAER